MDEKKLQSNDNQENEKVARIKNVAQLVKQLIGDRSLRRTSADSGVAASYISGIIHEKYMPSAVILRKLADIKAKPQGGVTLEDLMIAAGYQSYYPEYFYENEGANILLHIQESGVASDDKDVDQDSEDIVIPRDVDYISPEGILIEKNSDNKESTVDRMLTYSEVLRQPLEESERRKRHREIEKDNERYVLLTTAIIYRSLDEQGTAYSKMKDIIGISGYMPDLAFEISGQQISEWWFDIRNIRNREGRSSVMMTRNLLGNLLFVKPEIERKISLVVNDQVVFDNLVTYKDKLAYRGDLSVILLDEDTLSIVSEEYLAHYDLGSKASEIYIV